MARSGNRHLWRTGEGGIGSTRRRMRRQVRATLTSAGCTCGGNVGVMSDAELMHAAVTEGKTVLHRAGCRLLIG